MANVEINDLTLKGTPAGTDEYELQETAGGDSKKSTLSSMLAVSHNHAASEITSGTLAHERGGLEADISAVTTGGLIIGTGAGSVGLLGIGSADQVLKVSGGTAVWAAAGGGALTVLDRVTADVAITNNDTEQTLYSLSTTNSAANGVVQVFLFGSILNNTGAGRTVTFRAKLGATTIWDATSNSLTSSGNRRGWALRFILQNRGATNSQQLTGECTIGPINAPTTGTYGGFGSSVGGVAIYGGTAAQDWTSAKNLVITTQHSAADANLTITLRGGAVLFY